MKLLNKYQSRALQFALELFARLESQGALSAEETEALARRASLDYAGQVTLPLLQAGLLRKEGGSLLTGPEMRSPRLPLSALEREYLSYILTLPAASCFLDAEAITALRPAAVPAERLSSIERLCPADLPFPESPGADGLRCILTAIREGRTIRYLFRTRESSAPQRAESVPWKLEYSAYDHRWWLIVYLPEERRTVKAQLRNLSEITLGGRAEVTSEEIEAAMERLLEPEPIVLEVQRSRGALERCFLVFESQLFEQTQQLSENAYRLRFRYYRFDQGEILRKLLYLGPAVRLVSPQPLRKELLKLVDQALEQNDPLSIEFEKNEPAPSAILHSEGRTTGA